MATIRDMAILVVDDDQAVRDSLRRALALQGYDVELAGDGEEALFKLRANPHATDLLVVDVLMPRLDGLELTRRLRSDGSELPILMLTARDQVADRVEGLEAGADDYLVKPFAAEELTARLRALLRRGRATGGRLAVGDLTLDLEARTAVRAGREVHLTGRETALLELLMRRAETIVPRELALEAVWGEDAGLNVVDRYVARLRQKIGPPPLIHTARGLGFILRA
jgi:two-component system response regulator MprA